MQPGRNPLIDHNGSVPGKRPDSSTKTSETFGKVKSGAGVAWDKTKQVSVAAAHASKPVLIATKNGAVSLFEKTKAAFSSKK